MVTVKVTEDKKNLLLKKQDMSTFSCGVKPHTLCPPKSVTSSWKAFVVLKQYHTISAFATRGQSYSRNSKGLLVCGKHKQTFFFFFFFKGLNKKFHCFSGEDSGCGWKKKNSTSLFSGLQHATKNTSEKNSPSAASVADYLLNAVSHYIMLFWSSLALSFWQQSEGCSRWESSLEQQAGVHNKQPLHME